MSRDPKSKRCRSRSRLRRLGPVRLRHGWRSVHACGRSRASSRSACGRCAPSPGRTTTPTQPPAPPRRELRPARALRGSVSPVVARARLKPLPSRTTMRTTRRGSTTPTTTEPRHHLHRLLLRHLHLLHHHLHHRLRRPPPLRRRACVFRISWLRFAPVVHPRAQGPCPVAMWVRITRRHRRRRPRRRSSVTRTLRRTTRATWTLTARRGRRCRPRRTRRAAASDADPRPALPLEAERELGAWDCRRGPSSALRRFVRRTPACG